MRRISQCPRVLTHKTLLLSSPLSSSEKLFDYYNYKLYSINKAGKLSVVLLITDYNSIPSSSLKLSHSFKLLQDFSSCTNSQKPANPHNY